MGLSENGAIRLSLAISNAMFENDKPAREALYEDLDAKDLQRTLRWTTRMFLRNFMALCAIAGLNPIEAWQQFCEEMRESLVQNPAGELDEVDEAANTAAAESLGSDFEEFLATLEPPDKEV